MSARMRQNQDRNVGPQSPDGQAPPSWTQLQPRGNAFVQEQMRAGQASAVGTDTGPAKGGGYAQDIAGSGIDLLCEMNERTAELGFTNPAVSAACTVKDLLETGGTVEDFIEFSEDMENCNNGDEDACEEMYDEAPEAIGDLCDMMPYSYVPCETIGQGGVAPFRNQERQIDEIFATQ